MIKPFLGEFSSFERALVQTYTYILSMRKATQLRKLYIGIFSLPSCVKRGKTQSLSLREPICTKANKNLENLNSKCAQ